MDYKKPTKKFAEDFYKICEEHELIFLTAHRSPDDDAIASVLSVYRIIKEKYLKKKVKIVYTGEPNSAYKSFENFNKVEFLSDIVKVVEKGSLLVVCDGSQFSRFTYEPEKLKTLPNKTICIDHHSSPIDNFDLSLIDSSASSCVELIYLSFHKEAKIDKNLAEIYLLGILGDTGNFAYLKPHQTNTLSIAKKLLDIGKTEIQEFQSRYRSISVRVFALFQEFVKNTRYHKAKAWPDYQTSFVSRAFKNSKKYTDNEISEARNLYMAQYIRLVEGYTWGYVITPKGNGDCGVTLRSLPGRVSVRDLMEKIGIGGGHDRAAGGIFKKETEKDVLVKYCVKKMTNWLKEYKPLLG